MSTPNVDKTFRIHEFVPVYNSIRRPMLVSLGCHVHGAVNFWPDIGDGNSAMLGVMKRIAAEMPPIDPVLYDEFYKFAVEWIVINLQSCIIPLDEDMSVEAWLLQTNYTQERKDQLFRESEKKPFCDKKDFAVKQHVKHEPYIQPKQFRGIYSRVDFFKCKVGPFCFWIGKQFFCLKWFIKTLPMGERARFIFDRYNADWIKIASNDFTSFEATFVVLLMKIELFFYEFCLQNRMEKDEIMGLLRRAKTSRSHIFAKWFIFSLVAKRFSGEMDTSLMNSLMNILFVVFLLLKSGETIRFIEDFPPTVEGDDSVFAHTLPLDPTILIRLGANAKILHHDNLCDAQFCKIVFDENMDVISDPLESMLNFGYTGLYYLNASVRTHHSLIRAKSMSMLYTYPACPILRHLALYGLRVTAHITWKDVYKTFKNADSYKKDRLLLAFEHRHELVLNKNISPMSRYMVEVKYLIPVGVQTDIETYLDSLSVIQPLYIPHLEVFCDPIYYKHFDEFSVYTNFSSSTF